MWRRIKRHIKVPIYNLDESFGFSFRGLLEIFKNQRNARIIFLIAILVILLGIYLKIDIKELLILVLTIGLVFVAEIFNTMTEEILNIISPQFNHKARVIKDTSAAAVLVSTLIALVVGYFVFAQKILELILTAYKY